MLFFELFPLFLLFLSLVVGVRLIVAHREAARQETEDAWRRDGSAESRYDSDGGAG